MTIASAITAAQGRVADAYTSVSTMGGTLPATQNLTNLPAAIESIPTGGGGDTIYLANASGATISAGQKVLCNLGTIGSDTPTTKTNSTSTTYRPIVFFDNNTFAVTKSNSSAVYSELGLKVDGAWTITQSSLYVTSNLSTVFVYDSNGLISYSPLIGDGGYGYFMNRVSGELTRITNSSTSYRYLGESAGTHYIMKYNSTPPFAIYDIDTNTVGSTVTPTDVYYVFGKIIGNKGVFYSSSGYIDVYSIADTGFTKLSGTLVSSIIPLYITGADVGDYILCTDDATNYLTPTSAPASHLFCYQIQSDYSIKRVTVPALALFENKSCVFCFDNRNNVLSIGTDDNVYFCEYEDGVFKNLNVVLDTLPTNTNGYNYKTMMSPDKKTIVVYAKETTASIYVYRLTVAEHKIVTNSALNYQVDTSFTGFATGNTDSSGRYEVQTVLPSAVDYVLGTDLEPDETTIYGGVE